MIINSNKLVSIPPLLLIFHYLQSIWMMIMLEDTCILKVSAGQISESINQIFKHMLSNQLISSFTANIDSCVLWCLFKRAPIEIIWWETSYTRQKNVFIDSQGRIFSSSSSWLLFHSISCSRFVRNMIIPYIDTLQNPDDNTSIPMPTEYVYPLIFPSSVSLPVWIFVWVFDSLLQSQTIRRKSLVVMSMSIEIQVTIIFTIYLIILITILSI